MSYKKIVLAGLSRLVVALATVAVASGHALAAGSGSPELYAQLSPTDLDSLVAPVALYPDSLLAQVLGAATYPDQVVAANQFVKVNRDLTGDALRRQVENRGWDPAVQALTQFPSVLEQMAKNVSWTSALGDATANQEADVMAAVQRMRARAYSAGTLKSGSEIKVIEQSPQVIVPAALRPGTESCRIPLGLPQDQSARQRTRSRSPHTRPSRTPRSSLRAAPAGSATRLPPAHGSFFAPDIGHYLCRHQ